MAINLNQVHATAGIANHDKEIVYAASMLISLVMTEHLCAITHYYGKVRPEFWSTNGLDMKKLYATKPKISDFADSAMSALKSDCQFWLDGGIWHENIKRLYKSIGIQLRPGYIEDYEKFRTVLISFFGNPCSNSMDEAFLPVYNLHRAIIRAFCAFNKIFYYESHPRIKKPLSLCPTISYEINIPEVAAMTYIQVYHIIENAFKNAEHIKTRINVPLKYATLFKEMYTSVGGINNFFNQEVNKHLEYLGMLGDHMKTFFNNYIKLSLQSIDKTIPSKAFGDVVFNNFALKIMTKSKSKIYNLIKKSIKETRPIILANKNWTKVDYMFEKIEDDKKSKAIEAQQLEFNFEDKQPSNLPKKMNPKVYYVYTNTPFVEVLPGLEYSLVVSDVKPESHPILSTVRVDENGILIGAPEFINNEQLRRLVKEHFYANTGKVLLVMVNVMIKKN